MFVVRWRVDCGDDVPEVGVVGPFADYLEAEEFLVTYVPTAAKCGQYGYRYIEELQSPAAFQEARNA